jgi:hypothetical protein
MCHQSRSITANPPTIPSDDPDGKIALDTLGVMIPAKAWFQPPTGSVGLSAP